MEVTNTDVAIVILMLPLRFIREGFTTVRQLWTAHMTLGPWIDPIKRQKRKRALTSPLMHAEIESTANHTLIQWSKASSQRTSKQEESQFLCHLVEDLRVLIYREVLTGYTFHLSSITDSAPPRKFHCLRPRQIMDQVHGICHGKQELKHLLSLPLTCRQIYTETIAHLYRGNTLTFSQSFCFLNFLRVLPPQRYGSLRRISYYHRITERLVLGNSISMRDWGNFCKFMGETFSPQLELYLCLGPAAAAATCIRKEETMEKLDWLMPLWELSEKVNLKLCIPSGESGAMHSNKEPSSEPMSLVLNMNQIKKAQSTARPEDTLAIVHKKIQDALWDWRPYGRLIGEN